MISDFRKLIATRFLFTFAVQMQAVILGWRMYDLTHDPLFLGLVGLSEAIPAIGFSLYAGYVVDRSKPLGVYRKVVIASFLSALILYLSQSTSTLTIAFQIGALFISSFLTGTARAFAQPSLYALIPRIVSREHLQKSLALMTSALQIARISGPAVGGMIFGVFGVSISSVVILGCLIFGFYFLAVIKNSPVAPLVSKTYSLKSDLFSGARFVWNHPILLPAMSLDMISVLFGGVTALLPIYASEILMIGPKGLGILRATPAVGAALISLWLTKKDIRKNAGRFLFLSVSGFGLSIIVFGLSKNFWLSFFALACSGAFDSVSMIIRGAAVQLASPDHMRGRISAVNSIFISSSNELGEVESGIVAKIFGTVPAVLIGGTLCMVTVGIIALRSPKLRGMNLIDLEENKG